MEIEVINLVFDTFTAANTAKGFFSYFEDFINDKNNKKVFLIKGGPGSGKSTFMKKCAVAACEKGFNVERILCSSDNDSLDGVRILEAGIVIIDATSPHAFDMKYPAVRDSLIDLSRFWNEDKLVSSTREIEKLFNDISKGYKTLYSLLKVTGNAQAYSYNLIEKYIDTDMINNDIKRLIKQNAIMPVSYQGANTDRFFASLGKDGIVTLDSSYECLCNEYIVFDDRLGFAHIPLTKLQSYMLKNGYNTISIHSPLTPERLEGLIIPSLKLGFISMQHIYSPTLDENKISKRINTKKYLRKEISEHKNKLGFVRKFTTDFIKSASEQLKENKLMHDLLEKYYISAMDFKSLDEYTSQFIKKLL